MLTAQVFSLQSNVTSWMMMSLRKGILLFYKMLPGRKVREMRHFPPLNMFYFLCFKILKLDKIKENLESNDEINWKKINKIIQIEK